MPTVSKGDVQRLSGLSINGKLSNAEAAALVALTDSSGGSAANTIAAIGGTYDQAEVANAIASLAAKINAVIDALQAD